ncbi:hypothetical protein ACT9ST_09860 [Sphingobium limneticum]
MVANAETKQSFDLIVEGLVIGIGTAEQGLLSDKAANGSPVFGKAVRSRAGACPCIAEPLRLDRDVERDPADPSADRVIEKRGSICQRHIDAGQHGAHKPLDLLRRRVRCRGHVRCVVRDDGVTHRYRMDVTLDGIDELNHRFPPSSWDR